jgi:hypothetical protein
MSDRLLGVVRIGFGLLVLAAIVFMIWTLVDEGAFKALNFFTFFTILSNLLAMAVLLEGGRRQLTGQPPLPDLWRGAAVVYMTVTYLVFAVLLRDLQEELQTHVAWVDSVLHRVTPIVLMVDWLIEPPHQPIPFRRAVVPWLAFPLAWTAFTLVRGAIDGRLPVPVPGSGERWLRGRRALLHWDLRAVPGRGLGRGGHRHRAQGAAAGRLTSTLQEPMISRP